MITPLLYRLVVKLDDVETKTASGIVIPESITDKERKAVEIATVVSLGSTCFKDYGEGIRIPQSGDRVFIARYSGKGIKDLDGTDYVVINDEDVLCIISED